ncbi:MAG: hydroxyisourate hydrolase [Chloroflexota bacterium]
MATISSHVLDSVMGDHARGIRIQCFQVGEETAVFDIIANEQGRINSDIQIPAPETTYELIFHTAAYFAAQPEIPNPGQIMNEVVVRFTVPDSSSRIHIPLVLSPHSYTIWWSA